jgi:CRP/FNR family transcriptional regulator
MFHRDRFERILKQSKNLEHRLLEMTLDELDAARDWMVLLGRKTARERLASFLMIVAKRQVLLEKRELRDGMRIEIPLTREAIAEFLGLTIETVSRQFTALRKEGVLELPDRRHAVLADLDALREMAGDYGDDYAALLDD